MPSFWDKLQVAGQEMNVYASAPEGAGPFPGVVIAHSRNGVGEFACAIADRLAEAGYAAVVPDLFHRSTEEIIAKTGKHPRDLLSDPEIIADVDATVEWVSNHPNIDGSRLGITGFCMGGRVVWLMAATNPHFKAMVPYYGGNIMVPWGETGKTPFDLTKSINCPMLFHFGELDENPSQTDMAKLGAELTRLGKAHQFYTYPGADHAFMDHTGPRYHAEAAEATWPRTLDFFSEHLK